MQLILEVLKLISLLLNSFVKDVLLLSQDISVLINFSILVPDLLDDLPRVLSFFTHHFDRLLLLLKLLDSFILLG